MLGSEASRDFNSGAGELEAGALSGEDVEGTSEEDSAGRAVLEDSVGAIVGLSVLPTVVTRSGAEVVDTSALRIPRWSGPRLFDEPESLSTNTHNATNKNTFIMDCLYQPHIGGTMLACRTVIVVRERGFHGALYSQCRWRRRR